MKRCVFSLGLLAMFFAAAVFAADLPNPWRSWLFSRTLPAGAPGQRLEILLPEDVLLHSENNLGDLRVIDDRGAEVPYVIVRDKPTGHVGSLTATIREKSFVPGKYTQVVLDTGEHAAFHNRVGIETPASDYMYWVEVAASDDARTWRILNPRAPISRLSEGNARTNQTIGYPDTNARYLRLRILGTEGNFPVTGASIFLVANTREPSRTRIRATLVPDPSAAPALTRWNADLGANQFTIIEVEFETSQREFFRAVRVLKSVDNKEWNFAVGGHIYRFNVGNKIEESLGVPVYPDSPAQYWRVEILNKNNAPLPDLSAALAHFSVALLIVPETGRSYRLLYGNALAVNPEYDLARTLPASMTGTLALQNLAFGPEEATSNYADPRPFTERHPNLLWAALAVAVVLLGYAAMRSLRTTPAKPA